MIKQLLLLSITLLIALPTLAQDTGGQFWVQSFEDRNGNGQHDPGEPFLTRGISVDLLNADGVVMASATLDDAPYATRGYIGFYQLAPGQYTAVITSPDLNPTTPSRIDVTITQGAAPVTVMFGAQRPETVETAASGTTSSFLDSELARVALSGFGALVVIGVMAFFGVLVYALVLRRRAPADLKRTTSTGSMRRVDLTSTGEIRKP